MASISSILEARLQMFPFDLNRTYTYIGRAQYLPAQYSRDRTPVLRAVLEARSRGAWGEDLTGHADLLVLSCRAPHPHPYRTSMSCTSLASLRIDLSPVRSSALLSSAAIPDLSTPPARTLDRTYIDRTSYPPVPGTTCTAATPWSVLHGVPALHSAHASLEHHPCAVRHATHPRPCLIAPTALDLALGSDWTSRVLHLCI
ncbi:hypothetical protein B0H14DRAFT_3525756 [Mycena olivaceomarginata]|nr:hypothetical protein B0H14DRAFT_3525756 [Mycena olivaceomarginata]